MAKYVKKDYAKETGKTTYQTPKVFNQKEFLKAVDALNKRIIRIKKTKYADYSRTLKDIQIEIDRIQNDVYKNNPVKNSMYTKAGRVSTSTKGLTDAQKLSKYKEVVRLLNRQDLLRTNVKNINKKRAKKLGTTVQQYEKDKEFWALVDDLDETVYEDSTSIISAVETVNQDPKYKNLSYEEKKEEIAKLLDLANRVKDGEVKISTRNRIGKRINTFNKNVKNASNIAKTHRTIPTNADKTKDMKKTISSKKIIKKGK